VSNDRKRLEEAMNSGPAAVPGGNTIFPRPSVNIPRRDKVDKNKAMVNQDDRHWILRDVRLDKKGAHFPAKMDKDDFKFIGEAIFGLKERVNLWIGDWLVASERVYAETYKDAADALDIAIKSLYKYYYVCSRVNISIRRENLGYSHYALVAPMPAKQQERWINEASANGWSVNQLRNAIQSEDNDRPTLPTYNDVISDDGQRRLRQIYANLQQGGAVEKSDYDFLRVLVRLAKSRLG
jgi:hypothetical protein